MKRPLGLALFALLVSHSVAALAGSSTRIIATTDSADPKDRTIAIKNLDLIEITSTYLGGEPHRAYDLDIYLWVKPVLGKALGNETRMIKVLDVRDIFRETVYAVRKVGEDPNGYWVYVARMPVERRFHVALFAAAKNQGKIHYSNEGTPNEYFEWKQ